jgi:hypothetical protein
MNEDGYLVTFGSVKERYTLDFAYLNIGS